MDNNGKIGDRVWNDANNDGIQTAGESGIGNVTLRLYPDTDGITTVDQTYLATAVTDGSGNYQFVGLADTTAS